MDDKNKGQRQIEEEQKRKEARFNGKQFGGQMEDDSGRIEN